MTTSVYAGFQHNPPAIGFMGKKTWAPGKHLLMAWAEGVQSLRDQRVYAKLPLTL